MNKTRKLIETFLLYGISIFIHIFHFVIFYTLKTQNIENLKYVIIPWSGWLLFGGLGVLFYAKGSRDKDNACEKGYQEMLKIFWLAMTFNTVVAMVLSIWLLISAPSRFGLFFFGWCIFVLIILGLVYLSHEEKKRKADRSKKLLDIEEHEKMLQELKKETKDLPSSETASLRALEKNVLEEKAKIKKILGIKEDSHS